MKCGICGKETPDEFLSPFHYYIPGVRSERVIADPECALACLNKIHGDNRTEFTGDIAQQMLENFREWKNEERT